MHRRRMWIVACWSALLCVATILGWVGSPATADEGAGSSRVPASHPAYVRAFLIECVPTKVRGFLDRARRRVSSSLGVLEPSPEHPVILIAFGQDVAAAGRFTERLAADEFLAGLMPRGTSEPGSALARAVEDLGQFRDADAISVELLSHGEYLGTRRLKRGISALEKFARERRARERVTLFVLDRARGANSSLARSMEARAELPVVDASVFSPVPVLFTPRELDGDARRLGSCAAPEVAISVHYEVEVSPSVSADDLASVGFGATLALSGPWDEVATFRLDPGVSSFETRLGLDPALAADATEVSAELRFDRPGVAVRADRLLIPMLATPTLTHELLVPRRSTPVTVSGRLENLGSSWTDPVVGRLAVAGEVAIDVSAEAGCLWGEPFELSLSGGGALTLDTGPLTIRVERLGEMWVPFRGSCTVPEAGGEFVTFVRAHAATRAEAAIEVVLPQTDWRVEVPIPDSVVVDVAPRDVTVRRVIHENLAQRLIRFTANGRFEITGSSTAPVELEVHPPASVEQAGVSIDWDDAGRPRTFELSGACSIQAISSPVVFRVRTSSEGRFVKVQAEPIELVVAPPDPVVFGFDLDRVEPREQRAERVRRA